MTLSATGSEQVPIEVETKCEITEQERTDFLRKLVEELHFQVTFRGMVTDSFSEIVDSQVTWGKDFERYRHSVGERQGESVDEIVVSKKWWEVEDGQDIRRETPDVPVSLEDFAKIQMIVSLVKKRLSLTGIVKGKTIHVDMDTLYDYEPSELPANLADIPPERIRYFIEAERIIMTRADYDEAKADVKDFLKREFGKDGPEAPGMLSMALARLGLK